jgi:Domain of unknown function (DUF4258)
MKPIQISSHAQFEMRRRGIRPSEVIRSIRNPGQIVPSTKGREVYQTRIGKAGRLLLRVIVKEAADAYHVITAYKTSKIDKYWRNP